MLEVLEHEGFMLLVDNFDDGDIDNKIDEALKAPDSFWGGDDDLFVTWGMTFSTHRDDDALGRSNWDCMIEQLNEMFGPAGEKWDVLHSTHWGVGWVDQIIMPVIEVVAIDDFGDVVYAATDQFRWALEIRGALMEYPLLDESKYSQMEYDEFIEYLDFATPRSEFDFEDNEYEVLDELPDDYTQQIAEHLHGLSMHRSEDVSDDDIHGAMIALGFVYKLDEEGERIEIVPPNPNQLTIEED